MAGKPRFDAEEVEIRVRGKARGERQRPLVPWWMRLERRYFPSARWLARRKPGSGGGIRAWTYQRRSVVKARYTRNGKLKAGGWVRHVRYLTREGAQREHEKGIGFDAERNQIDMVVTVKDWERGGDELMWRLIVSPEDADRLDLKKHIRELVGAMERDLGTKLEWVAIDHHNTDNPHAHLLVRGMDERGKPLLMDREYVRTGIRARSQEIASRELARRLEPEMLRSRGETIDKERWTEIDRALQGRVNIDLIVDYSGFLPYDEAGRVRAFSRMQDRSTRAGSDRHTWSNAHCHNSRAIRKSSLPRSTRTSRRLEA